MNDSEISKLFLLACFASRENIIARWDGMPCKWSDLTDILGAKSGSSKKSIAKIFSVGAVEKTQRGYELVPEFFSSESYYSNLVILPWTVKYTCTPEKNKLLGMTARLFPWLHRRYNILCANPTERSYDRISPLSFGDIVDAIEETPKRAKELLDPFEIIDGAFSFLKEGVTEEGELCYVINPRLAFGDHAPENIRRLDTSRFGPTIIFRS